MQKVEAEDPQTVPHNGLELREAALWAPVPRSVRGAARRLGQRLIHSRAFRRASHTQLSARHPGQLQRVVGRRGSASIGARGPASEGVCKCGSAGVVLIWEHPGPVLKESGHFLRATVRGIELERAQEDAPDSVDLGLFS